MIAEQTQELRRRAERYSTGPRRKPKGQTVVVVDDGIATGATLKAALLALRKLQPERIVVAVPVAPTDARAEFLELADEFVCVLETDRLGSVGGWYRNFAQVSDEEVTSALKTKPAKS